MALAHILLENDSSTSLARQRVFRDRLNPIDEYNDVQFITRYRVTKGLFFFQLEERLLSFNLLKSINNSIISYCFFYSISCRTTFFGYWVFSNSVCIITWDITVICLPMYPYCNRCNLLICKITYSFSKHIWPADEPTKVL